MAFLGLKVPHDAARLLSEVDIRDLGEREPIDHYHVTMLYLGSKVALDAICKAIVPIYEAVAKCTPFTMAVNRVTVFPPHPDEGTVPLICPVESPELHALRKSVCESCDAAGVEYSKKFPEYKPHVTLAYSKEAKTHAEWAGDISFPTVEWGSHEVVLWGGDEGDKRIVVTFPLSIAISKAAVHRAFIQLSQRWSTKQVLDVSSLVSRGQADRAFP